MFNDTRRIGTKPSKRTLKAHDLRIEQIYYKVGRQRIKVVAMKLIDGGGVR